MADTRAAVNRFGFLGSFSRILYSKHETRLTLSYFSLLKYVSTNRFKYIVKDVRRQRCREEEENVWASFVKQQELNGYDKNGIQSSVQSIKQLLDEGMREVDKEIKKLETDILSDGVRKECGKIGNQKRKPKVSEFSMKIISCGGWIGLLKLT